MARFSPLPDRLVKRFASEVRMLTESSSRADMSGPVLDWVRPVREPVVWICQPPRSGGTLLLRLLDSHPQLHNYPSVFGFTNSETIWPAAKELMGSADEVLSGAFAKMSLEKFNRIGIAKQSSNMPQDSYPIYFDQDWFREIFVRYDIGASPRDRFNAFFTAVFNAWRNYQSLYFEKKYVVGHMTMRWSALAKYRQNFQRFFETYPDGYVVFITREPDDWMASYTALKHATPYTGDPKEAADFYKSYYRNAISLLDSGKLILLRFRDLVLDGESTMRALSVRLGIDWNPLLLRPSFNGAPWYQNSSFELKRTASIDSAVIGQGKKISAAIATSIDSEMWDLHNRLADKRSF
jgi:hypothetical protein